MHCTPHVGEEHFQLVKQQLWHSQPQNHHGCEDQIRQHTAHTLAHSHSAAPSFASPLHAIQPFTPWALMQKPGTEASITMGNELFTQNTQRFPSAMSIRLLECHAKSFYLKSATDKEDKAATAGSTERKGDCCVLSRAWPCWMRWSASSHVCCTSGAGSDTRLSCRSGVHSVAPIAPKASAACKCSTPMLPDNILPSSLFLESYCADTKRIPSAVCHILHRPTHCSILSIKSMEPATIVHTQMHRKDHTWRYTSITLLPLKHKTKKELTCSRTKPSQIKGEEMMQSSAKERKLAGGTYILTSWRTIGWKEEVSWSTVQSAGMAATSCICPKANAASCANRLDASLIATKPRTTRHTIKFSSLLPLPLHQKVNPKKPNKDKQDATTPHAKTSSENLSMNRPWKQTKVRETLRKEHLGGLQHRIKILNQTDRQTGRPTDRPTFDESLARSIALQVAESEESPPAIGDWRIGVQ